MILRYISLNTTYELEKSLGIDFCYTFNFNVTFITDYISKAIRKLKIEIETYNFLSINLTTEQDSSRLGLGSEAKSLIVFLNFTKQDRDKLLKIQDLNQRFEFYMNLIEKGYQTAVKYGHCEIQVLKLLHIHEMFRNLNYKNEWVWKKKAIKELDLYLVFNCYFTSFYFRLELVAFNSKKNKFISKGNIMNRPPDRVCFDKDFKGLSIRSNKLIILDFLDQPMFEIDLKKLQKGIFKCLDVDNNKFNFPDIDSIPEEEVIKRITW